MREGEGRAGNSAIIEVINEYFKQITGCRKGGNLDRGSRAGDLRNSGVTILMSVVNLVMDRLESKVLDR